MDEKKHPSQPQTGQENKEVEQSRKVEQNQKVESQKVDQTAAGRSGRKSNEGAKNPNSPRRLFSKKWVYPAIYLGAAALIIGLVYVKSQLGSAPASSNAIDTGTGTNTTTTSQNTAKTPAFEWPVAASTKVNISLGYFPVKGTASQQAKTLVSYDNAYYPHEGYDLKAQNGKVFDVIAAAGGTVASVVDDKLYGQTIVITSADGYTTKYESLGAADVKTGDNVSQGQVIGTSGTSLFEQSAGNHLYFAVYKDGQSVDPASVLPNQP